MAKPSVPPAARARSEPKPTMAEAVSIKSPAPRVALEQVVKTSTPRTIKRNRAMSRFEGAQALRSEKISARHLERLAIV